MKRKKMLALAMLVGALLFGFRSLAQEAGSQPGAMVGGGVRADSPVPDGQNSVFAPTDTQRPIRVEVSVVLVPVSVISPDNHIVTGLRAEHFQIFEDKKPQTIAYFSNEDIPLSVGLLFDSSGSMSNKLDRARMAVAQFFRNSNPQDEFLLFSFNDRPNLISHFSQDTAVLQNKLNFTEAKGRTSLLDAIYLGLHEMRKAKHSRKILLILSDGGDNNSRYTERDIREAAKEADVQIYAVGIHKSYLRNPEEWNGRFLLTEITEVSGGRHFDVKNLDDLSDVARKIAREMRNVYVLGYKPTNSAPDGKWRKIKVKLVPPRGLPAFVQVFAKSGYYAPQ